MQVTPAGLGAFMVSQGRTIEEKIVDSLLLLYLVKQANEIGYLGAELRVQKFVYLAETEMQRNVHKGFNYSFIRFLHGPYSKELRGDLSTLKNENFLYRKGRSYFLTTGSKQLLTTIQELLNKNSLFLSYIDNVVQEWAKIDSDDILETVYSQKPLYHPTKTLESLKKNTVLLKRMLPTQATQNFQITSGEAATIEILLDPEALESLEQAQESARTEPSKPWISSS